MSNTPGQPTITSSQSYQDQQSLVTWSAPSFTSSSTISSYNLQYSAYSPGPPWLPSTPYPVSLPTATTNNIFDWNSISNGTTIIITASNVSQFQTGDGITITYSSTDSIAGTISNISGNNVTINNTIFTHASYTSSTIYTSTPIDTSYYSGSPVNPIFPLNPAVSTPNPPIIPANTMITNGESYIYTITTPVNFTISILTTSNVPIGSPSQVTTTTTYPSANTFTFTNGVFVSPAQEVRIQANTGGQQVDFGSPIGGSFVNQDFCGFLQGYTLGYSQGTINVLPPSSSYTFTGLTNGTLYYFQVAAVNIYGTSGSYSGLNSYSSATPATTPDPVTGVQTTSGPGAGQISVSWTALSYPSQTGGLGITYTLQYREITTPPSSWTPNTLITPSSHVITGLATATTYEIEVKAVNIVGSGPYSSSVLGVTFGLPGIPTGLSGVHGNQLVTLTWIAPINTGLTSLTNYLVEFKLHTDLSWTQVFTGSALVPPYYVVGPPLNTLTNGSLYDFRVSAVNIVGTGSPSSPISVTPSTTPGPPVIIPSVTCDNQQVLVTWYPPVDDGGAPITSYNLQYSSISSTGPWLPALPQPPYSVSGLTNSYPFTGLTNGTQYYFQVQAVNFNGAGTYSASSTATPSITPQPPIPITTTAVTSTSIALSWTTPTGLANTGGNPVTGYLIYWSEISSTGSIVSTNSYTISGTPPATTYTIPGLTHATLYAIQVSSINCSGVGPLSSPPLYVTTSSIPPSAPTNVVISNCNTGYTNSVILTWTAPADDGGSPITNYVIYYRTSSVGSSPPGIWYTYDTNSAATTATISFLTPGTSYDFKIAAQNAAGVGIFSSPIVSSSSYNPPTTPTNLVATNVVSNTSSNGSIVLTWTASTQEGAQSISNYVIEYKICEFGGWITYPTTILSPTTSATLSNIGTPSNVANNVPYLFRVYAVNSCGAQSDRSNVDGATSYNNDEPTRLWSRFNLNCSGNITSIDNLNRNMLRKGQILQYPVVGTLQFSRATLWSMASKNLLTRQKAWASQSEEYTYPNITNINNQPDVGLRQTPTSLVCWRQPPAVICNSSTASDVPGTPTTLCISKNAPFDNFRRPITYSSGGTKFPVFFSK